MPISAIGMIEKKKPLSFFGARGFSLLEVMVVIVIISIIISFAVLFIDTEPEKLSYEGQRLTALMKLVSEEAIMNSREYRVVFTSHNYSFEKFIDGAWLALGDGVFRLRELPDNLSLDLTLENESIILDEVIGEDEQDIPAAILFLSSGEITPFSLTIESSVGSLIAIDNLSGAIETGFGQP